MANRTDKAGEAQAVRVAKAIADPMRFRMLREIGARPELSCRELVERFPIAQPTISHHLKVLTAAGLVAVRVEKGFHYYRLRAEVLGAYLEELGGLPAGGRPAGRRAPKGRKGAAA